MSEARLLNLLLPTLRGTTCATMTGAGHYAQDLQYPYFLWALQSFMTSFELPLNSLRVEVSSRKTVYATT
jgi:hypothetical protein